MLSLHKGFPFLIVAVISLLMAACTGVNPITTSATQSAAAAPAQTTAAATPAQTTATAAPAQTTAAATPEATGLAATAAPTGATTTPQPLTAAATLSPSLACTPGALTPAETEGPYYKTNPPEDAQLVTEGMAGTTLTITGYVFDANCQPVPDARVDFWQADSEGQYDNTGYTLRGYQVTDAQGRYTVQTVVPGIYPGRTRHIHVKVTPPNGSTLTTQLFFPDEPLNLRDSIFTEQNVLLIQTGANGEVGTFNFVVAVN